MQQKQARIPFKASMGLLLGSCLTLFGCSLNIPVTPGDFSGKLGSTLFSPTSTSSATPSITPTPTPTPTPVITDNQTIPDTAFSGMGVTFLYPSAWKIDTNESNEILIFGKPHNSVTMLASRKTNVSVSLANSAAVTEQVYNNNGTCLGAYQTVMDGEQAYCIVGVYIGSSGKKSTIIEYLAHHNGFEYDLALWYDYYYPNKDEALSIAENIAKSWKWQY